MSPGQTGHISGQMGRVPGRTPGSVPPKILYVYWFFLSQFKVQLREPFLEVFFFLKKVSFLGKARHLSSPSRHSSGKTGT